MMIPSSNDIYTKEWHMITLYPKMPHVHNTCQMGALLIIALFCPYFDSSQLILIAISTPTPTHHPHPLSVFDINKIIGRIWNARDLLSCCYIINS